jgi:hypothetical protein
MNPDCRVSWRGAQVEVTARAVPRYAFQSASIDVSIGGRPVLRTGGVLKVVGEHAETFEQEGEQHSIQLRWGRGRFKRGLPFWLTIDDATILEGDVPVQNWWLSLWPYGVILGVWFFYWKKY